MSGLFDQITNYSPPLLTAGQVNYKGTWSAATNSPTLTSPPAATSKGDYYVVSAAGTQFGIAFAVGDWIISNGTAWEKVDLTDAVSSVFGRTGAVVGVSTDYSSVGITNTAIGASSPSTGAFTTVTASSTIAATGAVTGSNLSGTNTGDQTISITGDATASGSTGVLTATVSKINGTALSELATGILKNTTTTGVPSIAVAADFPTLNQSTTGSAATLTTPRAIYGNNFDGSAALTQVIASTYGGTGNGFAKFSGPASSEKTFTLPNANATLLYDGGALGTPASGTVTNLTGTASININGTVGATTANTGAFTTLSASGDITANFGSSQIVIGAGGNTNSSTVGMLSANAAQILLTGNTYYGSGADRYSSTNYAGASSFTKTTGIWNWITYASGTAGNALSSASASMSLGQTGLAVTGALSATGTITSNPASGDNVNFQNGAGVSLGKVFNDVGFFNLQGSANVSGTRIEHPTQVQHRINGATVTTTTSTGLAVTGLITATGQYQFNGNRFLDSSGTELRFGDILNNYTTVGLYSQGGAAMTLKAGNVGIGTTSPAAKLHVRSSTSTVVELLRLDNSGNAADNGAKITWANADQAYDAGYISVIRNASLLSQDMVFATSANWTTTAPSEKVRITGAGNVGIGTTSPAKKLHISGDILVDNSTNSTIFLSNDYYKYITIAPSTGDYLAICQNPFASGIQFGKSTNAAPSTFVPLMTIAVSGNIKFNTYGAGALTTDASGNITAASDERIKSNIRPFSRGLAEILAINPILHGYTEESGLDQSRDDYAGFSAQQVQQLIPEAIGENADGMLSFSDRPVMAALVNAMKELNANLVAQVAALSQRLAALEQSK